MPILPGPYEIYDAEPETTVELRILRYQQGDVEIHPEYQELVKVVRALRLHVTKPLGPGRLPHIDITSKRLQVMLLEELKRPDYTRKVFKITKHGIAPKAWFELEVRPVTAARA